MQCNWLIYHFDFLYLSSLLSMHSESERESSWLSTIKVSANREICCQYTAIVRSSRVVLSYTENKPHEKVHSQILCARFVIDESVHAGLVLAKTRPAQWVTLRNI